MANIKIDEDGPTRPLPAWACLMPAGLLVMGVFSSWFVFVGLLFGLFFLGESIGRLGRGGL